MQLVFLVVQWPMSYYVMPRSALAERLVNDLAGQPKIWTQTFFRDDELGHENDVHIHTCIGSRWLLFRHTP